jgi:hypothetical protein
MFQNFISIIPGNHNEGHAYVQPPSSSIHNFESQYVTRPHIQVKDAGSLTHELSYHSPTQGGVNASRCKKERTKDNHGEYPDFNVPIIPKERVKKQEGNL